MTLNVQLLTMGAMIVGGWYLGMANDTFRRFQALWKKSRILTYLFEIAFWLIQIAVLFYVLYRINYGEIRFYYFVALAFGFALYIAVFQTMYKKMLNLIINFVKKLLFILYKLFIAPIIYLTKFIFRLLFRIVRAVLSLVHAIGKRLLPEKIYKFIAKNVATYSTIVNTLYKKLSAFKRK